MTCSWLNLWIKDYGHRQLTVKLYPDFVLGRGSLPLTPVLLKDQLCLSFCDWLISLSIMTSSFIYVVAYDKIFFLLKTRQESVSRL